MAKDPDDELPRDELQPARAENEMEVQADETASVMDSSGDTRKN